MSKGRTTIWAAKKIVKSEMHRSAAARPSSREPARPTAKIVPATSHPRPIMLPASTPTTVRGSSLFLALWVA